MSKVTRLPGHRTVTLPVARGTSVRLTPLGGAPRVLLELRGPLGGDRGAFVVDAEHARLMAEGLARAADGADPPSAGELVEGGGWRACGGARPCLRPEATLVAFARLAVPVFADWCSVDVADGDGPPRRLAIIHADTSKRKAAETLARHPHDPRLPHPRSTVWAAGEPDLAPDVSDSRLAAAACDAEHLAVLRALAPRSSLAVPLLTNGQVRGVITFALAESRRRYTEVDLPLGVMLAGCAALAAENARLYCEVERALRTRTGAPGGRRARPDVIDLSPGAKR
jgi:GAF domain-containing protein